MPKRSLNIGGRELMLDARPDKLDLRDLPYRPPLTNLPDRHPTSEKVAEYLPMYYECNLILDQGAGGCVHWFRPRCSHQLPAVVAKRQEDDGCR